MTFPVVIEGSGEIVGEVRLLGFGDASQRTLVDSEWVSDQYALAGPEVEHFSYVMRSLREVLGANYLRSGTTLHVAVTDGGYLSYADHRSGRVAVPHQLLRAGSLPVSEEALRLVQEDVLTSATYVLLGDRFARGIRRYIDRFANPVRPLWDARLHMVVILAGLHRYLHLDLESQILLRDAYEQVELGDEDRQPYAEMLRGLEHLTRPEVPPETVGGVIGLVGLSPALFPEFTDQQLLAAVNRQFIGEDGGVRASEEEILDWVLTEHRTGRDVGEVLWKEHIESALNLERSLRGINLRHNRPSDVLRRVAGESPLHAITPLYLAGRSATTLEEFCSPVEDLCLELQANLSLGVENLRTYMHLVFDWIAELQRVSRYPGDRVEFLDRFARVLRKAECRSSESVALAYSSRIDNELRFKARRRAAEDRAEAMARERSRHARQRARERLLEGGENVSELATIARVAIACDPDLLTEDARGAVNDLLELFHDRPGISTQLMAVLERLVKSPEAGEGFREAMTRRYSLSHDREISYDGQDTTELLEIYCSLLVFEDQVPELEDAEGKLDLRTCVRAALHREKGILRGVLHHRRTGWVEDLTTGEVAQQIRETIEGLGRRAEQGKAKARTELADAHFRLGLWAVVYGDVDSALTHLREVVRLTLDEELLEHMHQGRFERKIDPARFGKSNRYFRARETEIRRARAAGTYLELHARRAERDLELGKRPEIEPDQLDKILETLETERVLGDRAPVYRILRYLPRVETIGKAEYRIRDLLPAGAGGQAGQMALLRHVFTDEPFAPFMGYKIIETRSPDGRSVNRYVSKVGINDHVRREYRKVFQRLFPSFEQEMIRQRNGLPNQIFTRTFVKELHGYLRRKSKDDADLLRAFDAQVLEVVEKDCRFPLLLLEFIPGLDDDLPKTIYGRQAGPDGTLSRQGPAVIALETGLQKIREGIKDRLARERGLVITRQNEAHIQRLLDRARAHSAALAVLFMNVDHQIFTVDGRVVAMDYEILFAPAFDPEFDREDLQPGEAVSTFFTRRINVAWVTDRDRLDDYMEVAGLYRSFVLDRSDRIMDWAMDAGFLLSEAGAVKDLLLRNANRLAEDLQTLVRCGGTVYLCGNRKDTDGQVEYGSVVPRNEFRTAGLDLGALLAAAEGRPLAQPIRPGTARSTLSEMTSRLTAMQAAIESTAGGDVEEISILDDEGGDATVALSTGAVLPDEDLTLHLQGSAPDEDLTLDLRDGAERRANPDVPGDDSSG